MTKGTEYSMHGELDDDLPWVHSLSSHPVPSVLGWALVYWTLRPVPLKVSDTNLQSVTLHTLGSVRNVWVGNRD